MRIDWKRALEMEERPRLIGLGVPGALFDEQGGWLGNGTLRGGCEVGIYFTFSVRDRLRVLVGGCA